MKKTKEFRPFNSLSKYGGLDLQRLKICGIRKCAVLKISERTNTCSLPCKRLASNTLKISRRKFLERK